MKLVGCSVFRAEFEHVLGPETVVTWLPAGLHVTEERLGEAIGAALEGTSGGGCLYGLCYPDIDVILRAHAARRLPARTCAEAFLSPETRASFYAAILDPGQRQARSPVDNEEHEVWSHLTNESMLNVAA